MSSVETEQRIQALLNSDYNQALALARSSAANGSILSAHTWHSCAKAAFANVLFDDALEAIQPALAQAPDDTEILNTAAWIDVQFSVERSHTWLKRYIAIKSPAHESSSADRIVLARPSAAPARISILLPAKNTARRADYLTALGSSLNKSTRKPQHVEIILKIDPQDVTSEYKKLAILLDKRFGITILQGSSHQGLSSLHMLYEDCFSHRAAASELVVPISDRTLFYQPSWDRKLCTVMNPDHMAMACLTHAYRPVVTSTAELAWMLPMTRPTGAVYACKNSFIIKLRTALSHIEGITHFGVDYNLSIFLALVEHSLRARHKKSILKCMPGLLRQLQDDAQTTITAQDKQLLMMQTYYFFIRNDIFERVTEALNKEPSYV
jgi:hypothetical protein